MCSCGVPSFFEILCLVLPSELAPWRRCTTSAQPHFSIEGAFATIPDRPFDARQCWCLRPCLASLRIASPWRSKRTCPGPLGAGPPARQIPVETRCPSQPSRAPCWFLNYRVPLTRMVPDCPAPGGSVRSPSKSLNTWRSLRDSTRVSALKGLRPRVLM